MRHINKLAREPPISLGNLRRLDCDAKPVPTFADRALVEKHSDAFLASPCHMARPPKLIVLDHEGEIVWDAQWALKFKTCAGRKKVADGAIDAARTIELNRAGFERAMSRTLSVLVHAAKRLRPARPEPPCIVPRLRDDVSARAMAYLSSITKP